MSATATGKKAIWTALIRTHHITSRKKVTKLRQAATQNAVYVLLRSGGSPGVMYVEGPQHGVERWVHTVQRLRYKDYQLAARPAEVELDSPANAAQDQALVGASQLSETESVKGFSEEMRRRGVFAWWRKTMGYSGQDGGL